MTPDQRKSNRRLALILASVAAVFAIGFVAKIVLLGAA
ncbi:cytochrome oxidase small assembly protein [Roseateles amylovorans]|uniref:Cytochrome oxidase small assembly protein n=1 Tax=Roseateles amylovorans TaxID=2978473 RepID=A0ABY6AXQ8_9BURK|nr:cytochrome oxidase small assembly protein [Roseateles amylovorans]UXH77677.1 cytochrome oxidase small assembly protein [Roseateles amylovorans]